MDVSKNNIQYKIIHAIRKIYFLLIHIKISFEIIFLDIEGEKMAAEPDDSTLDGSNDVIGRTTHDLTDALFTARVFLPGFFQRNVFLIMNLVFPLVDFSTDVINAGNGLHKTVVYCARVNIITHFLEKMGK